MERRLPPITDQDLAMVQRVLGQASRRFAARGEHVIYLRSTFMPRQQRLLSFFDGESLDLVRAVNEAALVRFISIEPAPALPGPEESTAL